MSAIKCDKIQGRSGDDVDLVKNLNVADTLTVDGVDITTLVPTPDEAAALHANTTLSASNPVASKQDIIDGVSSAATNYKLRTATNGSPASGEVQYNDADVTAATLMYFNKINSDGADIANLLLLLSDGDALVTQVTNDHTFSYNFDINGTPTLVGDVIQMPVQYYSMGTSGPIPDDSDVSVTARYDGSNSAFLAKDNNLNDLSDKAISRTNLEVMKASDIEENFARNDENLSELTNKSLARQNLGVDGVSESEGKYLQRANNLSDVSNATDARGHIGAASTTELDAISLTLINHRMDSDVDYQHIDHEHKMAVRNSNNANSLNPFATMTDIPIIPTPPPAMPIGSIIMWAATSIPSGWYECNGQNVSQAVHPVLYGVIGSNVPDLRGQFIRGWDHGRGQDPDAATRSGGDNLLSTQDDEFKSHNHTDNLGSGAMYGNDGGGRSVGYSGATTGNTGGSETRPTNINLMFIIKGDQ